MHSVKYFLVSFIILNIFSGNVLSDESELKPELVIGSIMPSSVGASASASAYGFTATASYDLDFENGNFAGVAFPILTENGSATELLIGYGNISYDKLRATATLSDGSASESISGSVSIAGDISALAAVYSYKTSHEGLYFGGGGGAAYVQDEITSLAGNSNISGKETGIVPIGSLQAGYRIIGDGTANYNLDLNYRYLYFLSGRNGLDDLTANSVFVNFTIPL